MYSLRVAPGTCRASTRWPAPVPTSGVLKAVSVTPGRRELLHLGRKRHGGFRGRRSGPSTNPAPRPGGGSGSLTNLSPTRIILDEKPHRCRGQFRRHAKEPTQLSFTSRRKRVSNPSLEEPHVCFFWFQPLDYALELDADVDLASEGGPFCNANPRCPGAHPPQWLLPEC